MHPQILRFIEKQSHDENIVNRLIVTLFIEINKINVIKNQLIKSLVIGPEDTDYNSFKELLYIYQTYYDSSFSFDNLIELFEFVISPADKVINGAVYTPKKIREFIVYETIKKLKKVDQCIIGDISCGCGGFLYSMAIELKKIMKCSYKEIFKKYLWGLDIKQYSIERSKIVLTLLALINQEDYEEFSFNLFTGNALDYDWNGHSVIKRKNGFDAIIGNPPYVCSRNIDTETKKLLNKWSVNSTGHPDLYITFFEIGIKFLKENGILGFITVNTFFKSLNGKSLREFFHDNKFEIEIIDFGAEQIFKSKSTYTCICFITKKLGNVKFVKNSSTELSSFNTEQYNVIKYDDLNYQSWILSTSKNISLIKKIENTGTPLSKIYKFSTGIATLKNDIYKFKPIKEDNQYYYLAKTGKEYSIEKKICKDIINTNKITQNNNFNLIKEKIIFPYDRENGKVKLLPSKDFKEKFPNTYRYLSDFKTILSKRDKGNNNYEKWYAFGRNQSLEKYKNKLFFPHVCSEPTFLLNEEIDLLFYNGMAIIHDDKTELLILKKILESSLFLFYIKQTSRPYSSNYFSLSKNYIKSFGIYTFSDKEKKYLLGVNDKRKIDSFLCEKYGINLESLQ